MLIRNIYKYILYISGFWGERLKTLQKGIKLYIQKKVKHILLYKSLWRPSYQNICENLLDH